MAKKSSTEKDIEKKDSENIKKNKSEHKSPEQKKGIEDLKLFVRESFKELKKIQWPTRKQVTGETIVVIITVTFLTFLVTVFDKIIAWGLSFIFVK